jgi:hypothetical protein
MRGQDPSRRLKQFQEKWKPVFRPELRQNKEQFQEKWKPVFRPELRRSKELAQRADFNGIDELLSTTSVTLEGRRTIRQSPGRGRGSGAPTCGVAENAFAVTGSPLAAAGSCIAGTSTAGSGALIAATALWS